MDLKERLKTILRDEFGITTDDELIEVVNGMEPLDIGIFTMPLEETDRETESRQSA